MRYSTCLLFVFAAILTVMPAGANPPWYETRLVGMEVGPTGAQWGSDPRDVDYAARFNGREIVEQQIKLGSEYLVLWGRDCEWAYYDSKVMPKCPGLGARDPLREAVDAAKPHRLPVIVYTVVQAGGGTLARHPEFAMYGADDKPIPGRVCLNGPYRAFMRELLDEMLAYDIDGFHIDMLDQGFGPPYGCFCKHCRALFREQYGREMPTSESWDGVWNDFLEFRYDTSANLEAELRDHVRKKSTKVSVDFNYHGYPPFSFEVGQRPVQHAHVGDFVTCESGVWGFSALNAGLTAEFVRATAPDKVYQVVMQRGARFYHDQTTRPVNDLRWEMFALLAHGAQVTIVDKTPFDGGIDPVAYGRMGEVFQEVQRKRAHFGQPPLYDVALFYSHRARDWFARGQKEKYQQSFFGAHKALVYAHLNTGVLLDENLSASALDAYPVVVLPGTTIIQDHERALFEDYVKRGGKLLVLGQTGCYDYMGQPLKESTLAGLIGGSLQGLRNDNDNFVRLQGSDARMDVLATKVPLDWPHLIYGPAAVYAPTTATALGEQLDPVRSQRQKDGLEGTTFPQSPGKVVGPAMLLHRVGQGEVLTLGVAPDAAGGGEYRTAEARHLLANAVRYLRGKAPVAVDAPQFVETVVTHVPGSREYRVHAVGYLPPPGAVDPKRPWIIPELIEDTPLYRMSIEMAWPTTRCEATNPTTKLRRKGNRIEATINDIHEVITIAVK